MQSSLKKLTEACLSLAGKLDTKTWEISAGDLEPRPVDERINMTSDRVMFGR